ncbi:MAG: ribokinase [Pseudomonadota bacterium]
MIWNLGSINADTFYRVPHLPSGGETVAADSVYRGLGGKGANMSVAAARAAARVMHIGAVGADGAWTVERLLEYGVQTQHINQVKDPTGQAIIMVDARGENSIVLLSGANHALNEQMIGAALTEANLNDTLLMQNETNGQAYAARTAKTLGLRVAYAAAPFSAQAVQRLMPHLDMLFLNEVEARQLSTALGHPLTEMGIDDIVVTLGSQGCKWVSNKGNSVEFFPPYAVDVVDTTGAGDTFTGYLLAGLDRGLIMVDAIDLAQRAGALMVSRKGTADVIPDLKDIEDFNFTRKS